MHAYCTVTVAVMIVSVLQHDNGNLLCVMAKAKKPSFYEMTKSKFVFTAAARGV